MELLSLKAVMRLATTPITAIASRPDMFDTGGGKDEREHRRRAHTST
jgi:hypothetical protein